MRDFDQRSKGDPASREGGSGSPAAPGKSTLTEQIYRQASGAAVDAEAAAPALGALGGSTGSALPAGPRARFETSLGADLSGVRVHTGAASQAAADQLGARAFTAGRDIHFAAGQYRVDDLFGMHLLAHEVAHTQQQGGQAGLQAKLRISEPGDAAEQAADAFADHVVHGGPAPSVGSAPAGVIHRVPAAPSYGGVTAVPTRGAITIDAVADFVASSLTAARPVHAHTTDARVTHLSWELYNPSDTMIGGFCTLPGNASSLTEPFNLEPRYFSGTGFAPGRYILRVSGLNAQHQPVIYTDRNINVMAADQATGTGTSTGHGTITFTRYDKSDGTPANPAYNVSAEIRFTPDATASLQDVVFMQATQTQDAQGNSQHNTTSVDQDARQTPLGWSIDRIAGAPGPFYIEGYVVRRRGGHNQRVVEDIPGWGQAGQSNGAGHASTPATLIDTPYWNHENFFKAEAVAMCRSGPNRGQIYGACTWGYTATSSGQVTLMPRSVHPLPSDQFTEAKNAWNDWQSRQPAATAPARAP